MTRIQTNLLVLGLAGAGLSVGQDQIFTRAAASKTSRLALARIAAPRRLSSTEKVALLRKNSASASPDNSRVLEPKKVALADGSAWLSLYSCDSLDPHENTAYFLGAPPNGGATGIVSFDFMVAKAGKPVIVSFGIKTEMQDRHWTLYGQWQPSNGSDTFTQEITTYQKNPVVSAVMTPTKTGWHYIMLSTTDESMFGLSYAELTPCH